MILVWILLSVAFLLIFFYIESFNLVWHESICQRTDIFWVFWEKNIRLELCIHINAILHLYISLLAWLLTFDFVNHSKCTSKQKDFNGRNVKIKISEMFSAFTVHLYYLKLPLHCIDTILFWPHSDELWTMSNLYQKDIFQKFYCLQKVVAFNKYATS